MMDRVRWENFIRERGAVPIGKHETRHGTVLLAEGEQEDGTFLLIWAIERNGMSIGREIEFPPGHDLACIPLPDRQRARINAALRDVDGWMQMSLDSALYG